MSQRILIGTVVLLAIACLAASGFAWMAVQDGREVNRVMLEKLAEISITVERTPEENRADPMEWVPVRFKLVLDGTEGQPAQNFRATLLGNIFSNEQTTVELASGNDGIVNFNYLKPGPYRMTFESPWNEMHDEYLVVMPGTPIDKTIVCPSKPIDDVAMQFEIEWPDDLLDEDLRLAWHVRVPPRRIGGFSWNQATPSQPNIHSEYWLLLQPTGEAAIYPHLLRLSGGQIRPDPTSTSYQVFELKPDTGLPSHVIDVSSLPFHQTISIANRPTQIDKLFIVKPSMAALAKDLNYKEDSFDSVDQGFPIIARWPQEVGSLPNGVFLDNAKKYVMIPPTAIADESTEALTFEPQPGEKNVWTIELPESLIARTREALKALDEFKAEQASAVEAKRDVE